MDMLHNEVRNLSYNEFSETKSLEHASQQARARNYQDFLIVDVDSHHTKMSTTRRSIPTSKAR